MRKILIIPFLLLLGVTVAFGLFNFGTIKTFTGEWFLTGLDYFAVIGAKGFDATSPITKVDELLENWDYVVMVLLSLSTLITMLYTFGSFKKKKKVNKKGNVSKINPIAIAIYFLTMVVTAITLSYVLVGVAALTFLTFLFVATLPNKGEIASTPAFIDVEDTNDNLVAEISNELSEIENLDSNYVQPQPMIQSEENEVSIFESEPEFVEESSIEELIAEPAPVVEEELNIFEEPISFEELIAEPAPVVEEPISFEELIAEPAPVVEEVVVEPSPVVEEPVTQPQPTTVDFNSLLNNAKSHYKPYQPIPETDVVRFAEAIDNAKSHYKPYQPIPETDVVRFAEAIVNAKSHYKPYQPIPEPAIAPQPQQQPIFIPSPDPIYVTQQQPVIVQQSELVFMPVEPSPINITEPSRSEEVSRSTAERVELLRQLTAAPDYSEDELYYHPKPKQTIKPNRQPFIKKTQPVSQPDPIKVAQPVEQQRPVFTQQPAPRATVVSTPQQPSGMTDAQAYREELKRRLLSKSN